MQTDIYHVIFNPAAGGGKSRSRKNMIAGLLTKYFGENYNLYETRFNRDAENITRYLSRRGCKNFIAVGGDGTIHEIVNGLFTDGKLFNSEIRLGIISSGTGEGFAQSFGLPRNTEQQIKIIRSNKTRLADLGRIKFNSADNRKSDVIFINEFQAGIGGEVVKSVQGKQKILGGTIAYGVKTLLKAITCRNKQMNLCVDNKDSINSEFLGILAANGSTMGGSMKLAPGADPCDNSLNLLIMHSMRLTKRLKAFTKIYNGSHVNSRYFGYKKISSLSLSSTENVPVEADGEVLGYLPCYVEIIPSALKIFSP